LAQVLLLQAELVAHQDIELVERDAPAAVHVHTLEERKEVAQVGVPAFERIVELLGQRHHVLLAQLLGKGNARDHLTPT
jgi:hypothetical protein